jgi:hypothetical protein
MGFKKLRIVYQFEFVGKVAKNLCEKKVINEKVTEKLIFVIFSGKSFGLELFGVIF